MAGKRGAEFSRWEKFTRQVQAILFAQLHFREIAADPFEHKARCLEAASAFEL
jgi:hypothetical protein